MDGIIHHIKMNYYIEIADLGNALDFGDLSDSPYAPGWNFLIQLGEYLQVDIQFPYLPAI